mgnify:CR=1 FL=1
MIPPKTLTYGTHNAGYFGVAEYVFIPQADQVQVVLRYNNSTLKYVAEDYGKPEPLKRGEDWFTVSVTIAYDLTPENKEDNALNNPECVRFERHAYTSCVKDTKNLYNYERLTFDGIDILDHIDENGEPVMRADVLAVYVDIYFNENIDYQKEPMGTLMIYVYGTEENRPTFIEPISDKDAQILADFAK